MSTHPPQRRVRFEARIPRRTGGGERDATTRKLRGEFLLNFMSEHVNRHAEYPKIARSIGRFLADPSWESDFYGLPGDWSNERRILELLKRRLKQTRAATYVPDFPILKPQEERIKMRLVLGTHSPKGREGFRDVQEKVEHEQTETRRRLQEEKPDRCKSYRPCVSGHRAQIRLTMADLYWVRA